MATVTANFQHRYAARFSVVGDTVPATASVAGNFQHIYAGTFSVVNKAPGGGGGGGAGAPTVFSAVRSAGQGPALKGLGQGPRAP